MAMASFSDFILQLLNDPRQAQKNASGVGLNPMTYDPDVGGGYGNRDIPSYGDVGSGNPSDLAWGDISTTVPGHEGQVMYWNGNSWQSSPPVRSGPPPGGGAGGGGGGAGGAGGGGGSTPPGGGGNPSGGGTPNVPNVTGDGPAWWEILLGALGGLSASPWSQSGTSSSEGSREYFYGDDLDAYNDALNYEMYGPSGAPPGSTRPQAPSPPPSQPPPPGGGGAPPPPSDRGRPPIAQPTPQTVQPRSAQLDTSGYLAQLQSAVLEARRQTNAGYTRMGQPTHDLNDEAWWSSHYLPQFTASMIGPNGVQSFGLHEFQGPAGRAVWDVVNNINQQILSGQGIQTGTAGVRTQTPGGLSALSSPQNPSINYPPTGGAAYGEPYTGSNQYGVGGPGGVYVGNYPDDGGLQMQTDVGSPQSSIGDPRMPIVPVDRPRPTPITVQPREPLGPGTGYQWGSGGASGNRMQVGGSLYSGFGNMIAHPDIDATTRNAIQQEALNAARAGYADARTQLGRRVANTGNSAGYAAGRAALARGEAGSYGQITRGNLIDFEQERQRRLETGLRGFQDLYSGEGAYNLALLAQRGQNARLPRRTTNTDTGTTASHGTGYNIKL